MTYLVPCLIFCPRCVYVQVAGKNRIFPVSGLHTLPFKNSVQPSLSFKYIRKANNRLRPNMSSTCQSKISPVLYFCNQPSIRACAGAGPDDRGRRGARRDR